MQYSSQTPEQAQYGDYVQFNSQAGTNDLELSLAASVMERSKAPMDSEILRAAISKKTSELSKYVNEREQLMIFSE